MCAASFVTPACTRLGPVKHGEQDIDRRGRHAHAEDEAHQRRDEKKNHRLAMREADQPEASAQSQGLRH